MTTYRCTSSVRVQVYQKTSVYVMTSADTREALPDVQIVQCTCSNSLSQGGSFSVTLKSRNAIDYARNIRDDDWVDISFGKNGVYWHVLRGVIDDVRLSTEASDSAISTTLTISGRSFQKAWETTTSYFFPILTENLLSSALFNIAGKSYLSGPPEQNVQAILFKLFDYIGTLPTGARANWELPPTLPVSGGYAQFNRTSSNGDPFGAVPSRVTLSTAALYDTSMVDDLRRITLPQNKTSIGENSIFGDQSLWQMAQGFCDSMFCELFTDVLPSGGLAALHQDPAMRRGLDVNASRMAVVQRDKPFLIVSADTLRPSDNEALFFQLPLLTVRSDEIRSMSLGKNGTERFNCFNVAPASNADSNIGVSVRFPLWSYADMETHGMRRLDAPTRYFSNEAFGEAALRAAQKSQLCDFYCMNAEYFSGALGLANPHPEIRVGTRLRISSATGEDFEGYVEAVSNAWAVNRLSTQVQVTRGFFGSVNDQMTRLRTKRTDFAIAGSAQAFANELEGQGA